jgi:glycerophosphoryl diester phosphodiesterase
MTLRDIRALDPETLTLDQAVEHVRGRLRLLLDIKGAEATAPLGAWLSSQTVVDDLAVCGCNRASLEWIRNEAPRIARWQSFPRLGSSRSAAVAHVLGTLVDVCVTGHSLLLGSEVVRAGMTVVDCPRTAARHLIGSPWRSYLPSQLQRLIADVRPVGLTVDHRLVSPALCEAAAAQGLEVTAWTINNADALRRVVADGVASVTTDNVVEMRLALAA